MAHAPVLKDFEALLQGAPPTRRVWQQVCNTLDAVDLSDDVIEETLVPKINTLLKSWDPHTRPTPQEWVHQLLEGEHVVRMGIARFLDLRGHALMVEDAELLAESPELLHIKNLHLAYNGLQDDGVLALAHSPYLAHIDTLDLAGNSVGFRGVQALVNSEHLRALRHLDLTGNWVDDEAALCIAQAPNLCGLETLVLRGNPIHQQGAQALAQSPHLSEAIKKTWKIV